MTCITYCMTHISVTPLIPHGNTRQEAQSEPNIFGGDGIGFDDLIDVVNPLQHVPVVSHFYRAVTGDTLSAGAQVIGGGVFGGVLGAASSATTAIIEGINGESILDTAFGLFEGEEGASQTYSLYAPESATALRADNGEALVSLIESGAFTHAAPVVATPVDRQEQASLDLRQARDPVLGLTDQNKQQQLQANLQETALDMV